MKAAKLSLKEIKVESFVTSLSAEEKQTINGASNAYGCQNESELGTKCGNNCGSRPTCVRAKTHPIDQLLGLGTLIFWQCLYID
ncbi:MAG: pinensin family lanthipeptide [Bacteroidetes bacterium]|nr:pinensin family lanthipeptide [Bacteroidota bacterium]